MSKRLMGSKQLWTIVTVLLAVFLVCGLAMAQEKKAGPPAGQAPGAGGAVGAGGGPPGGGGGGRPDGFARQDLNGDGKITEAEAVEAAKNQFKSMDTNGDGTVTREEYQAGRQFGGGGGAGMGGPQKGAGAAPEKGAGTAKKGD